LKCSTLPHTRWPMNGMTLHPQLKLSPWFAIRVARACAPGAYSCRRDNTYTLLIASTPVYPPPHPPPPPPPPTPARSRRTKANLTLEARLTSVPFFGSTAKRANAYVVAAARFVQSFLKAATQLCCAGAAICEMLVERLHSGYETVLSHRHSVSAAFLRRVLRSRQAMPTRQVRSSLRNSLLLTDSPDWRCRRLFNRRTACDIIRG